jgi:hypothetical protein
MVRTATLSGTFIVPLKCLFLVFHAFSMAYGCIMIPCFGGCFCVVVKDVAGWISGTGTGLQYLGEYNHLPKQLLWF